MLAALVVAAFDAVPDYDAVDLAPVEPLGSTSVLGRIDQNNVLATARGTEVVADPTIALALLADRLFLWLERAITPWSTRPRTAAPG